MSAPSNPAESAEPGSAWTRASRLTLLAALIWIAAVAWTALRRDDTAEPAPAVVVLVVWDSIALEHLGPYGYDGGATPALDALAQRALVYEEHVPCVDSTAASVASLLTGLRPRHHGLGRISPFGRRRLPNAIPTLAERFRAAGWRTIASVSLPHLAGGASGLARGFDVYEGPPEEPVRAVRTCEETLAAIREPLEEALGDGERVFVFLHLADVRAPELAREAGAGRFLTRVATRFENEDPALAAELALAAEDDLARADLVARYERRRGNPVLAALDDAFYDAALARMDAVTGAVVALAEAKGRRALIVVTGGRAGSAPFGGSDDPAEPDRRLRAPLVLRLPADGFAGRARVATQDLDLAPTIASVAHLAPFERCDGLDLAQPLFAGEPPAVGRVPVIESGDFARRVAVGERWILADHPDGSELMTERLALGEESTLLPDEGELAPLSAALHALPPMGRLRVETGAELWLSIEPAALQASSGGGWHSFPPDGFVPLAAGEALELARADGPGALELEFTFAEARPALDAIAIGARALSELDLPELASGADPWPTDAEGAPLAAEVTLEERRGGWSALRVGAQAGARASAVVEWEPAEPLADLGMVRAPEGALVERHPRRAGAVVVSGPAPLELELRRRPDGRIALACALDGRRVAGSDVRATDLEGVSTRFASERTLALFLSPGAWADPELYTPAPAAPERGVALELLDPPPAGPPDPPLDARELLRRKQLSTTD